MVWQPTAHVWAGDEVKVDVRQLEDDAMQGIETTAEPIRAPAGASRGRSSGTQSMSMSASESVSAGDLDEES